MSDTIPPFDKQDSLLRRGHDARVALMVPRRPPADEHVNTWEAALVGVEDHIIDHRPPAQMSSKEIVRRVVADDNHELVHAAKHLAISQMTAVRSVTKKKDEIDKVFREPHGEELEKPFYDLPVGVLDKLPVDPVSGS